MVRPASQINFLRTQRVYISKYLIMAKRIQHVHGLHLEQLHRPLQHGYVFSKYNLIKWQIVFDNKLALHKNHPTPVRIEWSQNVVLGQVNGQLDNLFMQFLESLVVQFLKGVGQRQRYIVIVNRITLRPDLLHTLYIYHVSVTYALQHIQLALQHRPLLGIPIVHLLPHQNLPGLVVAEICHMLTERKLVATHLYYYSSVELLLLPSEHLR
jgi:hypothetical protein